MFRQPHPHAGEFCVLFAHVAPQPDGSHIPYSTAALRQKPGGDVHAFTSHIRCTRTRQRDFHNSQLSRKELAQAPPLPEVKTELTAFLDGAPYIHVYAPLGGMPEVRALIGGIPAIDVGFTADFFAPWHNTTSLKSIWETVHNTPRDKTSFTAAEAATLVREYLGLLAGTVLADSNYPGMAAVRYYLAESQTLFGDAVLNLHNDYTSYFGGLVEPSTTSNETDWQQFLPEIDFEKPDQPEELPDVAPLPDDVAEQLFEELARRQKGFRVRPVQQRYARSVAHTLSTGAITATEAGTGTGKTLGYLLPVLEFLRRNPDRRAVVSTYTKSLQEQLSSGEISTIRKLFDAYSSIDHAVVKGKSTQICAEKLDDAFPSMGGKPLLAWLYLMNMCLRWDKTDLDNVSPTVRRALEPEGDFAALVSEVSAGSGCSSRHKRCPGNHASAQAAKARLCITNHAKLALLPQDPFLSGLYNTAVIDEANHFEHAVRHTCSPEINSYDLTAHMIWMQRTCRGALKRVGGEPEKADRLEGILDALSAASNQFGEFARVLAPTAVGNSPEIPVDLHHPTYPGGNLQPHMAQLGKRLNELATRLGYLTDAKSPPNFLTPRTASRMRTKAGFIRDAVDTLRVIYRGLGKDGQAGCAHVSIPHVILRLEPVNVSGHIRNLIYENMHSVFYTSGTIAEGKDFSTFRRAVGMDSGDETVLECGRTFPCRDQIIERPFTPDFSFFIPQDTVNGSFKNRDQWLPRICRQIPKLIRDNGGRTLVLFASYSDLAHVRAAMEEESDLEYPLLFQQKGEPSTPLAEEFAAIAESVLFGVETFWHGMDFPGDTLTQVIVTRLPNPHPGTPFYRGLRKCVPEPVFWQRYNYDRDIKFRQGAGRLIRREDDHGRVVVLDTRFLDERHLHMRPINRK